MSSKKSTNLRIRFLAVLAYLKPHLLNWNLDLIAIVGIFQDNSEMFTRSGLRYFGLEFWYETNPCSRAFVTAFFAIVVKISNFIYLF